MKLEEIRSLSRLMQETGLSVLDLKENGTHLRLERAFSEKAPLPATSAQPQEKAEKSALKISPAPEGTPLKAPMVGVFYNAPSPDAKPFVSVGDFVKKGDTLCVIEAMKLFNEISAEKDGKVLQICVRNGQVVEYGQTLFYIG
ncbi:acetyl-CoA carboxylase biotin carboxyl carrier protein [Caproicibacterium sp. NSD3]